MHCRSSSFPKLQSGERLLKKRGFRRCRMEPDLTTIKISTPQERATGGTRRGAAFAIPYFCRAISKASSQEVAADAVSVELVSKATFPGNREKCREIRADQLLVALCIVRTPANPNACSKFPYASKQGIIFAETGNFGGRTGKLLTELDDQLLDGVEIASLIAETGGLAVDLFSSLVMTAKPIKNVVRRRHQAGTIRRKRSSGGISLATLIQNRTYWSLV